MKIQSKIELNEVTRILDSESVYCFTGSADESVFIIPPKTLTSDAVCTGAFPYSGFGNHDGGEFSNSGFDMFQQIKLVLFAQDYQFRLTTPIIDDGGTHPWGNVGIASIPPNKNCLIQFHVSGAIYDGGGGNIILGNSVLGINHTPPSYLGGCISVTPLSPSQSFDFTCK